MAATTPPDPVWVRRVFYAGWIVAAVAVVVLLVMTAGHPLSGGPSGRASYLGSHVPTGTKFTFDISETISLYALNLTGSSPSDYVSVVIQGNWSASAPTAVEATVGGSSPACPDPWGCYGAPGTLSGSINISLSISTDPANHLEAHQVTVALVFWAVLADTVTATSPIFASATG